MDKFSHCTCDLSAQVKSYFIDSNSFNTAKISTLFSVFDNKNATSFFLEKFLSSYAFGITFNMDNN
ncbi:MAG: hypothetical protein P1U46_01145 [Patescibacteria group bacterium]|nr:hypothetical protein [Patescibacteria group bacterium]